MALVSLPMYDLPEIAAARKGWWRGLARAFKREGIRGVPKRLCDDGRWKEHCSSPELLFSQTCGYVFHPLAGRVRVIATPCYAAEGCEGADYSSMIVVREEAPVRAIEDLRGGVAAVNDIQSQSGYSALRSVIAPHQEGGRFFARVIVTAAHIDSVAAVATGAADVAAIDCVTYALIARYRPAALDGIRVLGRSPRAPGLPYITGGDADDDRVARFRAGLRQALADPGLVAAREAMLLVDAVQLPEAAYRRIDELEAEAVAHGYPRVE